MIRYVGANESCPAAVKLKTQGPLRICVPYIYLLIVSYDSWVVHWFSCPPPSVDHGFSSMG